MSSAVQVVNKINNLLGNIAFFVSLPPSLTANMILYLIL